MISLIPEQFNDAYANRSAALRSDHVFCVYDNKGKLVFLSPTIRKLLGYSVDEFMQYNWAHMLEDTLNDDAEIYLQQSLEGEHVPAHPVLYEHKNGGIVMMEFCHWPVFDKSGKVSRIEGFLRDITAAKLDAVYA